MMENLKLISVRIDTRILDAADKMRQGNYYWKRNTIINKLLLALIKCSDNWTLFKLMQSHENELDKFTILLKRKDMVGDTDE